MVYYGKLSKGCERCRRRKVKCDQQQPSCLRCLRFGVVCPGYRDLGDLLFRDESARIIRRACKPFQSEQVREHRLGVSNNDFAKSLSSASTGKCDYVVIPALIPALIPLTENLGAHFYFKKFVSNDVPLATHFRDWLMQSYVEGEEGSALRSIIEAIGLSAISNIRYTPAMEREAKQKCNIAVKSLRFLLSDLLSACLDSTLMTVILLGQYETVNFRDWNQRDNWLAHIKAITVLLGFRGKKQFESERGAQIYVHARSSVVSACAQQQVLIPLSLVQITQAFQASEVRRAWHRYQIASPGSICELSFRLVNLMADFHGKTIDSNTICTRALDIDSDHQLWRQGLPRHFEYRVSSLQTQTCTNDPLMTKHLYPNLLIAEAWNHWRTQRILVNKIIIQSSPVHDKRVPLAQSVVQEMCTDLCVSALSFTEGPRMISLIEPLFLVSIESSISLSLRYFAIEQLHRIGRSTGIRQAIILADAGDQAMSGSSTQTRPSFLCFENLKGLPENSARYARKTHVDASLSNYESEET